MRSQMRKVRSLSEKVVESVHFVIWGMWNVVLVSNDGLWSSR